MDKNSKVLVGIGVVVIGGLGLAAVLTRKKHYRDTLK